jgi:hypothetical protein
LFCKCDEIVGIGLWINVSEKVGGLACAVIGDRTRPIAPCHAGNTRNVEGFRDHLLGSKKSVSKTLNQLKTQPCFRALSPAGYANSNSMVHLALRHKDGRAKQNDVVAVVTALPSYAPSRAPRPHQVEDPEQHLRR